MSSVQQRPITCAKCNRPDSFVFYDSVNVTLDPELRERVLNRTLFDYRCPGCGVDQTIAYPFLYHDMTNRLMCWMKWVRPGAALKIDPEMNAVEKDERTGYRYRVVCSLEALFEIIFIVEAKLDDLAVQMVKAMIHEKMKAQPPPGLPPGTIPQLYFSHVERELILFAVVGAERGVLAHMPIATYERLRAHHTSVGAMLDLPRGYKIIDMEVAARVLAR